MKINSIRWKYKMKENEVKMKMKIKKIEKLQDQLIVKTKMG